MSNILLIRLTAIGDVAMLLPLAYSVARANPEHQFTLLTQPFLTGLVIDPPPNLEAMAIDIRRSERSFGALLGYAIRLREEGFDYVLDLHNVLRTKVLRSILWFFGAKVMSLRKPRAERRRLLSRPREREALALAPMVTYYQEVFARAGLHLGQGDTTIPLPEDLRAYALELHPELNGGGLFIGIAPYASSDAKTYDLGQMEEVVSQLSASQGLHIYLFGGRGAEQQELERWAERYPNTRSVAGTMEFPDELALMDRLDLMVSMDSANMHLASIVGTRVVSLWCGTHPSAGFLAPGQSRTDCLTAGDRLDCAPCSIFGNNQKCSRGDWRCRTILSVEEVVNKIGEILHPADTTPTNQQIENETKNK